MERIRTNLPRPVRVSWRRVLLFGGFLLVLCAVGSVPYLPPRVTLREGMVSPYEVAAPRSVEYVDWERTERLREEAAGAVRPVYRLDPTLSREAERSVHTAFEAIWGIRSRRPRTDLEHREQLVRLGLRDQALLAAETLRRGDLERVRDSTLVLLRRLMREGVRPEDLPTVRTRGRALVEALPFSAPSRALVAWALERALRPNLLVDHLQTRRQQEAARASVDPVRERILRGEVIVRRGDVVTAEQMRKLAALGLVPPPIRWEGVVGTLLVLILLSVLGAAYLRRFQPEIWADEGRLLLLCLLGLVAAVGSRVIATRLSSFLVPVASVTMLLAILLNPRVASFAGGALALLVGVMSGNDLRTSVVAYVGGLTGVYVIRRVQRRADLAYAGLAVAGANVLAVIAVDLLAATPPVELLGDVGWGALNGLLSGILAVGALPYLEELFGLVTPIKLLELSDPSHPLLRRLQLEAPGTYHHTVLVANLAEAAAEAVGADALLVRVGTYYHDIGKLRRPAFFAENQLGRTNPHDRLSPSLSALAVAAHVRDGLELARQYRLPKPVVAFIPEHHGTSLIRYFYHRAVERGESSVDEQTYRYDGPKPQSRETAIVMLADAVEAAVRTLPNPTPERIGSLVHQLIRERLEDGQLDECDLTLRDLERIAQTFTRLLVGMFHPRIEYPEVSLEARRAQRRSGAQRAEHASR
ncbi:MAG: HDIG domain-containing protein [Armatimonadetes bacterium]|nr:HDIG domain-containing protein [Armatimonadota bacterium]MDW8154195.1 HDIG domain-containing protein [Armatimonadota bacterium]